MHEIIPAVSLDGQIGMALMVSFFCRQQGALTTSSWIGESKVKQGFGMPSDPMIMLLRSRPLCQSKEPVVPMMAATQWNDPDLGMLLASIDLGVSFPVRL